MILRRAAVMRPEPWRDFPSHQPMLAVGADLKNTVTLVVEGQAFVSQHIGDLDDYESLRSFRRTIEDLIADVRSRLGRRLLGRHDRHPQYVSTAYAH